MSGPKNLRKQDLNTAGSLKNEDRILATEGILSRKLSPTQKDAVIKAHEVGGFKTFGQYSEVDIAEKRALLRAAEFSQKESETLLWKGIAGYNKAEMLPLIQKRGTEFFGKPMTNVQTEAMFMDNELSSKSKDIRLKNLTDAGFSPQQAQEIVEQKIHRAGSVSATLAPPKPAPITAPEPARLPAATPPGPANPFVQNSTYQGGAGPDVLRRIANGGNVTTTEAKIGLSEFAKVNTITGANQIEVNFKSMQKLSEQIFKDAENIQKALNNPRLAEKDRKNLAESYEKIKAKCKALPNMAELAGLNGSTLKSNLQDGIQKFCSM